MKKKEEMSEDCIRILRKIGEAVISGELQAKFQIADIDVPDDSLEI